MLVVTESLTDRILSIESANLESRLARYAERPGNPSGVYLRRFGRATAFIAEHIPVRFFNSVLGVGPDTEPRLDAIEAFYREHGVACALEIVPGRLTEPFGLELARRGYAMLEFHVAMARTLDDATPPIGADRVRVGVDEIDPRDADRFEAFLDVYLEGWGTAPERMEGAKANMRGWRRNEAWRFYLARVGGEPAGAAILDVRGKTALLGSAGTRPRMRGRGVQAALIAERARRARDMGCDLVVGGAYYGTTSMRNQQRAGLATAFTRGIWVKTA